MKIALFDWTSGGHHPLYVRKVATALNRSSNVVVAVPDVMADNLASLENVDVFSLGEPRPALDLSRALAPQNLSLAEAELDLLEEFVGAVRPDHTVHLYADPVIRRLVGRRIFPTRLSICIFFARHHYLVAFRNFLPPGEILRSYFLRFLIARWSLRKDANTVFLLDEEAARRIPRGVWLPEPPVDAIPANRQHSDRTGCVLYGSIARRKGIDLLAKAMEGRAFSKGLVLAGEIEQGFETELEQLVSRIRRDGTTVELRGHRHTEAEGLRTLGEASCAVLPYPRHYGMSRVLLEACTVGTPVVVHDFGLLGYLVNKHKIGEVVDCTKPSYLRRSIDRVSDETLFEGRYLKNLHDFARRFSHQLFKEVLCGAFDLSQSQGLGRIGSRARWEVRGKL